MTEGVLISGYAAGPVERFGRRFKLEYVGMNSVYAVIGLLVFRGLPSLHLALVGAVGGFFHFLGIKKKTRDHLSGSLVLMAAALFARPAVVHYQWVVPYMLFGACICALEGYVEKRQEQILALPFIFLTWGWFGLSWVPALLFLAVYLSHPWRERPGLRRRLTLVAALCAVTPWIGSWLSSGSTLTGLAYRVPDRVPLGPGHFALLAPVTVVAAICLGVYWRRLIHPHRLAPILFALLAPWDVRLAAMFGMVASILLTATVFRLSIDSDRLRPWFKHAEWHYFWYVFALAIWTVATY